MSNNKPIVLYYSFIIIYMGLCPKPHFILCLETKNEARKFKPKRPPPRSAAMQEFQAKRASLLAEIPCIAAFTASPAPRFGRAPARCLVLGFGIRLLLYSTTNMYRSDIDSEPYALPQCVRSKITNSIFRRFAVQTKTKPAYMHVNVGGQSRSAFKPSVFLRHR